MTKALVAALCVATLATVPAAQSPSSPAADDALATVRIFLAALRNANLDGLVDTFEENATVFMPFADMPARLSGKAAIRQGFRPVLDRIRQSGNVPPYVTMAPRDIHVESLDSDMSVVTFHLGAMPTESVKRPVAFARRTLVLRRTDGRWRILHLHASTVIIEPTGSNERKEQ